jgi:hypothetical protein
VRSNESYRRWIQTRIKVYVVAVSVDRERVFSIESIGEKTIRIRQLCVSSA